MGQESRAFGVLQHEALQPFVAVLEMRTLFVELNQ